MLQRGNIFFAVGMWCFSIGFFLILADTRATIIDVSRAQGLSTFKYDETFWVLFAYLNILVVFGIASTLYIFPTDTIQIVGTALFVLTNVAFTLMNLIALLFLWREHVKAFRETATNSRRGADSSLRGEDGQLPLDVEIALSDDDKAELARSPRSSLSLVRTGSVGVAGDAPHSTVGEDGAAAKRLRRTSSVRSEVASAAGSDAPPPQPRTSAAAMGSVRTPGHATTREARRLVSSSFLLSLYFASRSLILNCPSAGAGDVRAAAAAVPVLPRPRLRRRRRRRLWPPRRRARSLRRARAPAAVVALAARCRHDDAAGDHHDAARHGDGRASRGGCGRGGRRRRRPRGRGAAAEPQPAKGRHRRRRQ